MGGVGSGPRAEVHATIENTPRIDLRILRKKRRLSPGSSGLSFWESREGIVGSVKWTVTEHGLETSINYRSKQTLRTIEIQHTPCNFGGTRSWLTCSRCYSRRETLFLDQRMQLRCRRCLNLCYAAQLQDNYGRLLTKRNKAKHAYDEAVQTNQCAKIRHRLFAEYMAKASAVNNLLKERLHNMQNAYFSDH